MSDYEFLEQKTVYHGVFSLSRWVLRHRLFHGGWSNPIVREVFQRSQAVSVLLYDPARDQVVLVKQFRPGAIRPELKMDPWLVELVAGGMELGEEPVDVAKRESIEEAGYTFEEWLPIYNYFTSPGASTEYMHVFCARISIEYESSVFGLQEEEEDILAFAISRERALEMLERGELCNAPVIIALQWLQSHYQRLQSLWLKK